MTNYVFIQNEKINGKGQCRCLNNDIINIQVSDEIYNDIEKYIYQNGSIILNPNYELEQQAKEKARIQELSMTRSDFFDGTIKAFGLGKSELQIAIELVLSNLDINEVEKAVALNNYENALNFYRKHPLFTMLSNIQIPISEDVYILINSEQWDRFFDETNKGNDEAYKELLPIQQILPDDETNTKIEVETDINLDNESNIESEIETEN